MRIVIAIAVVLACIGIGRAEAGRIPIVYQSGLETFESGPLPAPFDKDPDLAGWRAGYVCDVTGVFYTYFSVGDCRPAAVLGARYDTDEELAAAIQKIYPSESIPFWGRHGWKLMLAAIAMLVLTGYLLRDRDADADAEDDHDLVSSSDFDEGRTERAKPLAYDPKLYAKPRIHSRHAQQFAADPNGSLAYRPTDAVTAIPAPPVLPATPPPSRKRHEPDLPFAITQPLAPIPLPPRRAARGSAPELDDAGHTQRGWSPPPKRR